MSDEPKVLTGRLTPEEALEKARAALSEIAKQAYKDAGNKMLKEPWGFRCALRLISNVASTAHAQTFVYKEEKE